jgi:hypothetical protein
VATVAGLYRRGAARVGVWATRVGVNLAGVDGSPAGASVNLAVAGASLAEAGVSLAAAGVSLTRAGVSLAGASVSLAEAGVNLAEVGVSLTAVRLSLAGAGMEPAATRLRLETSTRPAVGADASEEEPAGGLAMVHTVRRRLTPMRAAAGKRLSWLRFRRDAPSPQPTTCRVQPRRGVSSIAVPEI